MDNSKQTETAAKIDITAGTSAQAPPAATADNTHTESMFEGPVQALCDVPRRINHNPIEAEMIAQFEPATLASAATPTRVEEGNTPTSHAAEMRHQLTAHSIRQWAATEFGSRSLAENEKLRPDFMMNNGKPMSAEKSRCLHNIHVTLKQMTELEEDVKELEASEGADDGDVRRIRESLKTIDEYITEMMSYIDRME